MKGTRIVRNAAALLAGQPITWVLTLVFTVIVPRNVGPGEWGEWTIAVTVGQLALMAFDLGTNTVLLKGISRYPDDSERTLGVAFMLRLILTPVVVLALAIDRSSAAVPVVSARQALEKMHFSAVAAVLNGVIVTTGAFVIVKLL